MRVLLTSAGLETEEIKTCFVEMAGKDMSAVKALFIPTAAIDADAVEVLPKCMKDLLKCGILDQHIDVFDLHAGMEFEKLQGIIAEVLNVDPDEITMDTTFTDDLGADSLDVFQIVMGIEEEFDIEIPPESAEKISTVEEAVELIKNALN